ncbi:glutamate--tRNA ligase [candidate division KSB1 bacterium 4572_119]|nr:MAG: glutamate--tRNA ligase [candidate division KSB1 bacterium 4572_119]
METRVRFAPSPTGHLHIGNARTAIMNWLFARNTGGKFILRIEDTDPERSVEEYIGQIVEDLKWLGLQWDEGPEIGGSFGPYRQSERLEIYQKYVRKLIDEEKAYYCFCTPDELEKMKKDSHARGEAGFYNRHCLNLKPGEKEKYLAEGRKPAVRFKVPDKTSVIVNDVIKGQLTFETENISDFVIMRGEGIPTYNFAVVVDDSLMKISHIIRGDDHVSNTPRQVLLYQALGFEAPKLVHIPMILGADKSRLSKRHGATSLDQYRIKGYLPEVLINFLSLLSWSSESGDEILTIKRLIEEFDFKRISKSAAMFDFDKLNWMNGHYIRNADLNRIVNLSIPYLQQAGYPVDDVEKIRKIISLVREKIDYLSQIPEHLPVFFQEKINIVNGEAKTMIRQESSQRVLWSFTRELDGIAELDQEIFKNIMKVVQKETGVMGKNLWMPLRIILTGQLHGPDLPMTAEILGKEKCKELIQQAIYK